MPTTSRDQGRIFWSGIITANNGWSAFVSYGTHIRGSRDLSDYSNFTSAFELFTGNLRRFDRQGAYVSEPPIYPHVIASSVRNYLRNPFGAEGQLLQALAGEYNLDAGPTRKPLKILNFESSHYEDIIHLLRENVINDTDRRFVVEYFVGRHASQCLDAFYEEPSPEQWTIDTLSESKLEIAIKGSLIRLNQAGLRIGPSALDALAEAHLEIYNELPDYQDLEYWRAVSFPWDNPAFANKRIPYPLNAIGLELFKSRDTSVANNVLALVDQSIDACVVYGPWHGLQIELIVEGLKRRGLGPEVYCLRDVNQSRAIPPVHVKSLRDQDVPFGQAVRESRFPPVKLVRLADQASGLIVPKHTGLDKHTSDEPGRFYADLFGAIRTGPPLPALRGL